MKTDRELLEYAAKAAGYVLPRADDHDEIGRQYEYHLGLWVKHPWGFGWFRPHIDDGRALRLAVKCGINPIQCIDSVDAMHFDSCIVETELFIDHNGDKAAATRRAIVRAAAQMQLNKENGNA